MWFITSFNYWRLNFSLPLSLPNEIIRFFQSKESDKLRCYVKEIGISVIDVFRKRQNRRVFFVVGVFKILSVCF